MGLLQRFKAFIASRNSKKDKDHDIVNNLLHPIEESKGHVMITVVQNTHREVERVFPEFMAAAIHHPEVLNLRSSLKVSVCGSKFEEGTSYISKWVLASLPEVRQAAVHSISTALTPRPTSPRGILIPPGLSQSSVTPGSPNPLNLYDFINIRMVGKGGFGSVYLVKHKSTGLKVALKVIDKRFCDHKNVTDEQRILQQVTIQGAKGNMELLGSFHNERHFFLVTSYYSRGDLRAEIGRWGCMPPKLTQFYAAELLIALQSLHKLGIIHRDIKPDNVLLTDDGHLVLADFGLATSIVPAGQPYAPAAVGNLFLTELAGTLDYMSPEMWKGEPYTFSTDVWSLAVVIFLMVLGRTPFTASFDEDPIVMEYRMTDATFEDWIGIDPIDEVSRLFLQGMLDKDAYDRPTLNEAKTHSFFRGIVWDQLAQGKLPVPDVGSPATLPAEDKHTPVLAGSFGGGGVYLPSEDPSPSFNYVSPALLTTTTSNYSHALNSLASVAPLPAHVSFADVPLTYNNSACSPCSTSSIPSPKPLCTPPLGMTIAKTITANLVTNDSVVCEKHTALDICCSHGTYPLPLSALSRFKSWVGKVARSCSKWCSRVVGI